MILWWHFCNQKIKNLQWHHNVIQKHFIQQKGRLELYFTYACYLLTNIKYNVTYLYNKDIVPCNLQNMVKYSFPKGLFFHSVWDFVYFVFLFQGGLVFLVSGLFCSVDYCGVWRHKWAPIYVWVRWSDGWTNNPWSSCPLLRLSCSTWLHSWPSKMACYAGFDATTLAHTEEVSSWRTGCSVPSWRRL